MTIARDTIKQALRESNLIAITADPQEEELQEGLQKLQSLIKSVMGFEVSEKLADWPVGIAGISDVSPNWSRSDWIVPPSNTRLIVTSPESEHITLDPFPQNGARISLVDLVADPLLTRVITLDANGRRIEGQPFVTIPHPEFSGDWMYRADLGDWVRLLPLELDSELPFPEEFDTFFETMLAMRLNPRYGRKIDEQTVAFLDRATAQLRATYRQTRPARPDPAVTRMSVQVFGRAGGVGNRRRYGWMK